MADRLPDSTLEAALHDPEVKEALFHAEQCEIRGWTNMPNSGGPEWKVYRSFIRLAALAGRGSAEAEAAAIAANVSLDPIPPADRERASEYVREQGWTRACAEPTEELGYRERPMDEDFYLAPSGQWVYKWRDERVVVSAEPTEDTLALAAQQLLGALNEMTTDGEPADFSANVVLCRDRLDALLASRGVSAEGQEP